MELNDDELIFLDAEELAEGGIKQAYEEILPKLRQYVLDPANVEEIMDFNAPSYTVKCNDKAYEIHSPSLTGPEGDSWGRATYILFTIVNDQLTHSSHRFYAVYGGNDLAGIFLTPDEYEQAKTFLPKKIDWPYLPTASTAWDGQSH